MTYGNSSPSSTEVNPYAAPGQVSERTLGGRFPWRLIPALLCSLYALLFAVFLVRLLAPALLFDAVPHWSALTIWSIFALLGVGAGIAAAGFWWSRKWAWASILTLLVPAHLFGGAYAADFLVDLAAAAML